MCGGVVWGEVEEGRDGAVAGVLDFYGEFFDEWFSGRRECRGGLGGMC